MNDPPIELPEVSISKRQNQSQPESSSHALPPAKAVVSGTPTTQRWSGADTRSPGSTGDARQSLVQQQQHSVHSAQPVANIGINKPRRPWYEGLKIVHSIEATNADVRDHYGTSACFGLVMSRHDIAVFNCSACILHVLSLIDQVFQSLHRPEPCHTL
jgi:hypothetical protein